MACGTLSSVRVVILSGYFSYRKFINVGKLFYKINRFDRIVWVLSITQSNSNDDLLKESLIDRNTQWGTYVLEWMFYGVFVPERARNLVVINEKRRIISSLVLNNFKSPPNYLLRAQITTYDGVH